MQKHYPYIMVGAGSATIAAAKAIRQNSGGPILIITNEDRLPYKRTQINKEMAKGFAKDEFAIFTPHELEKLAIDIQFGQVNQIIPSHNTVVLDDDAKITFDKLLLATGHTPKTLSIPQIDKDKQFTVYTAQEAELLMADATANKSYFIVGGGVEGIEMAHQLHSMGKKVTLIHRSEFLMHKELSAEVAGHLMELLLKNNIHLIHSPNITEEQFTMVGRKIFFTQNNISHFADAIVACIGSSPNIELAKISGLETHNGILADEFFRTSVPNIYAAGSVAELPNDPECHLWHHAEQQGQCAGLNMAGLSTPYTPKVFRLKADVFGEHFFSANFTNAHLADEMVCQKDGTIYRELYFKNKKIFAIVMFNDKPMAKQYQSAIWESWTKEELMQKLPL